MVEAVKKVIAMEDMPIIDAVEEEGDMDVEEVLIAGMPDMVIVSVDIAMPLMVSVGDIDIDIDISMAGCHMDVVKKVVVGTGRFLVFPFHPRSLEDASYLRARLPNSSSGVILSLMVIISSLGDHVDTFFSF